MTTALVDTNELEQKRNQMVQRVLRDGKLINLHIGRWSMQTSLNPEDLSMNAKDVSKLYKLGTKVLLDPSVDEDVIPKFATIEGQARRYLIACSFPFPIAYAHFIPKKRVLKVLDKLYEYREEFLGNVNKFVANYETYKEKTWELNPTEADNLKPFYPSPERIRQHFMFNISTFEMSLPKKMSKQEMNELTAEIEAASEMKATVIAKHEARMQELQDQAAKNIEAFVPEAAKALRSQVVAVFSDMAQKIKDGKLVSAKNVKSMKSMIDTFKEMNFCSDETVENELKKVEDLLGTTETFKDNKQAIQALSTAIQDVLTSTANMSDVDKLTGTYFRNLAS